MGTPKDEESLTSDAEGEEVVDDIKEEEGEEEKSDTTQRDIGRDEEEFFSWADVQWGDEGGGATVYRPICVQYNLPTGVIAEVTNDIVAVDLQHR